MTKQKGLETWIVVRETLLRYNVRGRNLFTYFSDVFRPVLHSKMNPP